MLVGLDHVAVAVASLEQSIRVFESLGLHHTHTEEVPHQKVLVAYFEAGGIVIELLQPTSPESPVAQFLLKHGPGLHHLAFKSDDLASELARVREQGFAVIGEPSFGGCGKQICFLHPRTTSKVLIELCSVVPPAPGDSVKPTLGDGKAT